MEKHNPTQQEKSVTVSIQEENRSADHRDGKTPDGQHSTNDSTFIEETEFNTDISMNYVLFWAVILGLVMNWLAMYLKISMGFVSVGIGPMAVLLIGRQILRRKQAASRENLVTIIIAYGATQAAEASVGLLFLLWLATNASFFGGLTFTPPWWLLPSSEVIATRTIFSAEWLVPLAVHYFLMLIPGVLGLIIGWKIKDTFIHDEEAYPFPGMISQDSQVGVLTDEAETKGPLFWRVARYGFVFGLATILIPGLFVIDFSDLSGSFPYILGIMLGPVGLALLAAGIIIGKPKVSVSPVVVSVISYTLLGGFLVASTSATDFYGYFNQLLQEVYFVPALGVMLGGLILGPILWSLLDSILGAKDDSVSETGDEAEDISDSSPDDGNGSSEIQNSNRQAAEDQVTNPSEEVSSGLPIFAVLRTVLSNHYRLLLVFTLVFFVLVIYIQSLQILPAAALWVVSLLVFWNIIIGGLVNGYLVTMGVAKSNSSISPPFVFDVLPIFLAGGTGFTSYVAMPTAETDGSAGIVSSQKLAQMNGIDEGKVLKAYLAGYFATSLTTPIFALMMWQAFGIGTASFPAPAFPVNGAILASFASRDVTSFIDLQVLAVALLISIILARLGADLILGAVIGLLFPPHMAIPMALGGVIRIWMDRHYDEEKSKDLAATLGPALAVGASFVIPIMIVLALF